MTESGIGVLDKSAAILTALESGPLALAELVTETDISRPTAHRLAMGLQRLGFVTRDEAGRFALGPRLTELADRVSQRELTTIAHTALRALADHTGEMAYLCVRADSHTLCVAAAGPGGIALTGLPFGVGVQLPLRHNAAGKVLLAWLPAEQLNAELTPDHSEAAALAEIRRIGWAQSVRRQDAAYASVAAPVKGHREKVLAAVLLAGPLARMTPLPGRLHAQAVMATAQRISESHLARKP